MIIFLYELLLYYLQCFARLFNNYFPRVSSIRLLFSNSKYNGDSTRVQKEFLCAYIHHNNIIFIFSLLIEINILESLFETKSIQVHWSTVRITSVEPVWVSIILCHTPLFMLCTLLILNFVILEILLVLWLQKKMLKS